MKGLVISRQMEYYPYAKKTGQNPRELAQRLIDALPDSDVWETSIAGPGFINFVLSPTFYLPMDRAIW